MELGGDLRRNRTNNPKFIRKGNFIGRFSSIHEDKI
jgi:hypothetical protein